MNENGGAKVGYGGDGIGLLRRDRAPRRPEGRTSEIIDALG